MSEIVFEVLCAEVLEALRGLGLGKFSIQKLLLRGDVANYKGVSLGGAGILQYSLYERSCRSLSCRTRKWFGL